MNSNINDLYNNGNFDLFKYQLEEEQKIIIFYILRKFPQEIKDQICEAIDLAIDKYLSEIDVDFYLEDNEWLIIETLAAESSYEYSSSECSDPEDEYQRRLIKQFSNNWWNENYS